MSRIELPIGDGVLVGDREGTGAPLLLLHGGPAIADYTDGLAVELNDTFETVRYTQRGTPPSTVGGPYSIETHMADALAVMDAQGWPTPGWRATRGAATWRCTSPSPIRSGCSGIVCVCPLGATPDLFTDMSATLARGMSARRSSGWTRSSSVAGTAS